MEKIGSKKMNDELINEINKLIKESFYQKGNKSLFVKEKLKAMYPNEKWSVIYIFQGKENKGYSYGMKGKHYICRFNNWIIIIISSLKKKDKTEETLNSQSIISKAKQDINIYISEISKLKNQIDSLQNIIAEKEKEINKYKHIVQTNDSDKSFYGRKDMIALNFTSVDGKISYAIPCTREDLFVDVEKKLYNEYPEYRDTNNYFLSQGKVILRFKSIEENNIKNGYPIILNQ